MQKVLYRSLLAGASLLAISGAAYADPVGANYVGSDGNVTIRGNMDNATPNEGVFITSNGSSTSPDTAGAGISVTAPSAGTPSAGSGDVKIYGNTTVTGTTNINTTGTANTTIGTNQNTTSINSSTVNVGTGAYATNVAIGSGSATTVRATAGAGSMNVVDSGTGMVVDGKGQITTGTVSGNTASLTTTNGTTVNGVVAQQNQTVLSGGNRVGTSMTLNDNGATFSNAATGGPVRVTGVADGTAAYDAVNVRQLRGVYAGVAGTAAMANIPGVEPGKRFGLGIGVGGFKGQGAVAIGASLRITDHAQLKASISTSANNDSGSRNTAFAIGGGLSF